MNSFIHCFFMRQCVCHATVQWHFLGGEEKGKQEYPETRRQTGELMKRQRLLNVVNKRGSAKEDRCEEERSRRERGMFVGRE